MRPSNAFDPTVVRECLAAAGVDVTPEQAHRLIQHAALVLKTNAELNLTRITEPESVVTLHIVDSLAFLPLISPLAGHIVDIGAGAGYPGIPLAILGYDVLLCESLKKKAAFLETCVAELELSTSVSSERAEELATRRPGAAEVVIARAVSALPSLVELAAPLLTKGGRLVAMKGIPSTQELDQAEYAASQCGMKSVEAVRYSLAGGEERSVFVYQRVARARIKLPRRNGMAQRQPLEAATDSTR